MGDDTTKLIPEVSVIGSVQYGSTEKEEDRITNVTADVDVVVPRTGGLGTIGAIFNVISSVLGGGILSFPYAFAAAGILNGIFSTLILSVFAYAALIIIILTYETFAKEKADSYQSVVRAVFGRGMELFMILSIALYSFGSCIAFLVIIGDQFVPIIQEFLGYDAWYASRWFIISTTTLVIVLPLCLMKEINRLKYSSFLATAMVYYFALMVIYFALMGTVDDTGAQTEPLIDNTVPIASEWNWKFSLQYFQSIPIICFAFQCHLSIIPIYKAMKDASPKRAAGISCIALINCTALYVLVGLFGYLTFFCLTQSDVLLNYDESNVAVIICRAGMGLVSCFAYPILNFVARLAINDFILWFAPVFSISIENEKIEQCNIRFYAITLIVTISAAAMAIFVPTINAVVSLLGSIFAVCFIFVFPGLFLIKLRNAKSYIKYSKILLVVGLFYIFFGIAMGAISLTLSVYNDIQFLLSGNVLPPC
uniref:Amino acid transporter transmembrane domain-containing protein n=1 Tax=Vannella robusta TaxID=1487602 RepID=A0A7S4IB43_9EUKA|mmetsp:Transcript_22998/g.29362  ORF Transcript_22998/g.29362 Transcript_22998/m.29362 type:complete len:480 (+) Transcript_22998:52-1491(+)